MPTGGINQTNTFCLDYGDAVLKRQPRLAPARSEKLVKTVAYDANTDAEIADKFANNRDCNNVSRREAWSMALMSMQCWDCVPPSAERIHRNRKQFTNLALSVAHSQY